MSPRPRLLVVMAGTATDVGKTWLGARTAAALRARGLTVAARKPAQSFAPGGGATDAEVLAGATGERPERICPRHRWYEVPMAPPMAAAVLGRPPVALDDLVAETTWDGPADIGLVESVGGVASPVADDGDTVGLCRAVGADVAVLVAHAGLGTINDVRLAASALSGFRVIVFLNRFDEGDDLHRRNRSWLADREALRVVTAADALADALAGLAASPG